MEMTDAIDLLAGRVPLTVGGKLIGWLKMDPESLDITGKLVDFDYVEFIRNGLSSGMLEFSFMQKVGNPGSFEEMQERFKEFLSKPPRTEAITELVEAIRLTVEYVGIGMLPPLDGWTWFDAVKKYDPKLAEHFVARRANEPIVND